MPHQEGGKLHSTASALGGATVTEMNPTWLGWGPSERSELRGGGWKHQVIWRRTEEEKCLGGREI